VIAGPLHADDYELIPPGGVPHSKEKYLSAVASGDLDYAVFEAASPVRVRLRGDTAILRYSARIGFGPDRSQDGLYWHTDYWERRDGRWQAVWSQATRRPPGAKD
jgi:hypothetical protein